MDRCLHFLERANAYSIFNPSSTPTIGTSALSAAVPQTILNALTDIATPRLVNERLSKEVIVVRGFPTPVHRCATLVLGGGVAGLRAAVELKRRKVDVVVASQSAFGTTSACSGSDKQTLHTANGAGRGDDFRAMADALRAGGAMDEDTAYVAAPVSFDGPSARERTHQVERPDLQSRGVPPVCKRCRSCELSF
jgi:FAD binding domain